MKYALIFFVFVVLLIVSIIPYWKKKETPDKSKVIEYLQISNGYGTLWSCAMKCGNTDSANYYLRKHDAYLELFEMQYKAVHGHNYVYKKDTSNWRWIDYEKDQCVCDVWQRPYKMNDSVSLYITAIGDSYWVLTRTTHFPTFNNSHSNSFLIQSRTEDTLWLRNPWGINNINHIETLTQ